MATAACKISFKINYTSSLPITQATAFYRIKNSVSYTKYDIPSPMPVSDVTLIELPDIQTPGEYDLMVELAVNGVTARQTNSFQIGKCNPLSCKAPSIKNVYLGENDQIIMDYSLDTSNLYAVQYQIATDSDFKNIVQLKVIMGSDYNPTQYIEMSDGTIKNDTRLYVRVRKHCSSYEVSDWSNVYNFTSGKWNIQRSLEALCLADGDDLSRDICDGAEGYASRTKVTLSTANPEVGSLIYLVNGRPATIDNIRDLAQSVSVPAKFQDNGIRWIKFSSVTPSVIYEVEPQTGNIISIANNFKCPIS